MRIRLVAAVALVFALSASAQARPVSLAWDPNQEPDVAGYIVVYGYASRSYTNSVNVGKNTTARIDNLPDDRTVYLAVKAYTDGGLQSPPSAEVSLPAAGARVSIDTPGSNALVKQPFNLSGWAADQGSVVGTGVDMVHVYAYPGSLASTPIFLGAATYGLARPDVAAAFDTSRFTHTGYNLTVTSLKPGTYVFAAFGHSTVTGKWWPMTRTIRIAEGPVMFLEAPLNGAVTGQPFYVSGWVVDTRAPSGTGIDAVTISVTPASGGQEKLLGFAYLTQRADVAKAFGPRYARAGFIAGISNLPPGTFILTVRAHSTVTHGFAIATSSTIYSGPLTAVDTPSGQTPVHQAFTITGWSIDRRSMSGNGISTVHVYAYPSTGGAPIFLGAATPKQSRPDVAAAYGSQFEKSGYSLFVPASTLGPGHYVLAFYPLTTVSGAYASPTARDIDVIP